MANAAEDQDFQQRIGRLEALIQEIERFADPAARAHTTEIVQSLLDLHGTGLRKVLETIAGAGEPGQAIIDALGQDDLVGSLLLLYGLHPLTLEARVRQALDRVRPSLQSHGADVELVGIAEGVVRLRMHGGGCHSAGLRQAVERAVYDRAPDATAVEVEEPANGAVSFVPVEELTCRKA